MLQTASCRPVQPGYDRKVWEHLSHFYDTNAWMPRNYVFVNSQVWSGLDAVNQAAIKGAAAATQAACTNKSADLANFYIEQLAANGMTTGPATEGLAADLAEIGATMSAEWLEAAGETGAAIVEAYNDM